MYNCPQLESQRLKQIQKSNLHVRNLVDSARKMIHNQKSLSKNEKEILQIKISIEKDHLKRAFYKIDTPTNSFNLEIVQKTVSTPPYFKKNYYNGYQNTKKFYTKQLTQNTNQKDVKNKFDETKIVLSRVLHNEQPAKVLHKEQPAKVLHKEQALNQKNLQIQFKSDSRFSKFNSYDQQKTYQSRYYTIEQPQKNAKITIETKQQPYKQNSLLNKSQKQQNLTHTKKSNITHTNKNKNLCQQPYQMQQITITNQSDLQPYTKQQISLSTPNKIYQIKNTHIVQNLQNQTLHFKSPKNEEQHKKYFDDFQKSQQNQTSYKEILQKNKKKLINSTQKLENTYAKTPNYQLNLQKLLDKKQQGKRRLYGYKYSSKSSQLNSLSDSKVKYTIAKSQVSKNTENSKIKSANTTIRSRQKSLSKQKSFQLHSTLIKGVNLPCSSPCSKCKSKNLKQNKQKDLSSYHLVKRYLTPEGEKQCYNFLLSQGIQEKNWHIFITQYVYRQLSKFYNQISLDKTY